MPEERLRQFQGKLITFEGIEGTGKSTNVKFVADLLTRAGVSVVITREPGGTPIAESIRQLLLAHQAEAMDIDTELLLFFAARAQHVNHFIKPALAAKQCVLSDRFIDASYAYQGGGRQIPMERIALLEQWVSHDIRPELTFLLDIAVPEGLRRARGQTQGDRIEAEEYAFFERVRQTYLQRASAEPNRFKVIPTHAALDVVQQQIQASLLETACALI